MQDDQIDDVSQTLMGKSDQLNADDLLGGPLLGRVTRVTAGSDEQPVQVWLDSWPRPWRPCLTDRRMLVACAGKDARQWVGRAVELTRDPDVVFGGKKVGGIRLTGVSGMSSDLVAAVAVARGKKAERRVRALPDPKPAPSFEERRVALVARVIAAGLLDDADAKFGPADEWDALTCKNVAAWLREVA